MNWKLTEILITSPNCRGKVLACGKVDVCLSSISTCLSFKPRLWLCKCSQTSHPRTHNCNWMPIHLCFPNVIIQKVCRCLQLRTGPSSVVYWNIFFSPFSVGMCTPRMFPTWIYPVSSILQCFTGILNLAMCHRFNQRKCGPSFKYLYVDYPRRVIFSFPWNTPFPSLKPWFLALYTAILGFY